jgi:hypothetical protein
MVYKAAWSFQMAHNKRGLAFVGELHVRQARTKADDCNIADSLLISQIYNVKPQ